MVTTPAVTPVTTPVVGCIEAIAGLLLVQTPFGVAQFKVVVEPTHTAVAELAVNVVVPAVEKVCKV
jgi:hypothetical protein